MLTVGLKPLHTQSYTAGIHKDNIFSYATVNRLMRGCLVAIYVFIGRNNCNVSESRSTQSAYLDVRKVYS